MGFSAFTEILKKSTFTEMQRIADHLSLLALDVFFL